MPRPKSGKGQPRDDREWIENLAQEIEDRKEETGEPFYVPFPWPLSEAQERLVRALGATPMLVRAPEEWWEQMKAAEAA